MRMGLLVVYGSNWSAFSHNLRSSLEILVANMGHGDCTGIFRHRKSLIVDFGTKGVKKYAKEAAYVEYLTSTKNERKLIVSHYHYDHYSLLRRLSTGYFHESYLPALPPETSVGRAVLEAITLFITLRYRRYFLIPEILRTSRRIIPLIRGNRFTAADFDWEVMWPDYRVLEQIGRVCNMVRRLRAKISRIRDGLSEQQRRRFDEIYGKLSISFAREGVANHRKSMEEEYTMEEDEPYDSIENENLWHPLEEIEDEFRTLANYTTLIVRNTFFLFMGDVDDKVLNDFVRLNDQPYLFVKASHHGKCYGRGLNSLSTVVLAVSRDGRTKIHRGYFHRMKWNILIDTARHRTCSIIL